MFARIFMSWYKNGMCCVTLLHTMLLAAQAIVCHFPSASNTVDTVEANVMIGEDGVKKGVKEGCTYGVHEACIR